MSEAPEKPPSRISDQFWDGGDLKELRRRLVMLFEKRHLSPTEDFAGEVLVRMLRKLGRLFSEGPTGKDHKYPSLMHLYEKYSSGRGLDSGEEGCDPDLLIYAYSIARNVTHEARKSPRPEPLPDEFEGVGGFTGLSFEKVVHRSLFPKEDEDVSIHCLHECFHSLRKDTELLLKYDQTDKKKDSDYRQRLADDMSISLDTLYVTVHRARKKVKECVLSCMERELRGSSAFWLKASGSKSRRKG